MISRKTLEDAVDHLAKAGSFFSIDLDTIKQGLEDALHRIQALEKRARETS